MYRHVVSETRSIRWNDWLEVTEEVSGGSDTELLASRIVISTFSVGVVGRDPQTLKEPTHGEHLVKVKRIHHSQMTIITQ